MQVCPRCNLKYPDDNDRCFVDGADLVEAPDEWLGATIAGKYLVETKIGEGGMATVYRARHKLVDRPVAVKIMNPQLAGDPNLRERFRREAKNAASLQHPNIIEINDYGDTDNGTAFMVMELLSGSPLSDLLVDTAMPPEQVASLGLQIAQGLARAHDFDVLHRDLKPDNIFVCKAQDGQPERVKILDFGIARSLHDARLTNAGEIFGTPQYMAPERVTSIDAGASADLYALGVIFFEMVTGRLPFEAEELTGYLIKHMQEPPPKPSDLAPNCPRRLEELILKLLAKSPDDRPVDAHQVMKELAPLVPQGASISMAPPSAQPAGRPQVAPTLPPTTLERWARRLGIFDQMLVRAFGQGVAPPELKGMADEIRGILQRIHQLRSEGLREQRKLESMEAEARDTRSRLGFAVHTLAEDLSKAREALRAARPEVRPYLDQEEATHLAYKEAHGRLEALGGYREMPEPSADMVHALRAVADCLDRWVLARGAAVKANAWGESKQSEVNDLEFQLKTLRGQLERVDGEYEAKREESEHVVVSHGKEAEQLERQMVTTATRLATELRPRPELAELFHTLEAEGVGMAAHAVQA